MKPIYCVCSNPDFAVALLSVQARRYDRVTDGTAVLCLAAFTPQNLTEPLRRERAVPLISHGRVRFRVPEFPITRAIAVNHWKPDLP
jgi:hypothetical protein